MESGEEDCKDEGKQGGGREKEGETQEVQLTGMAIRETGEATKGGVRTATPCQDQGGERCRL